MFVSGKTLLTKAKGKGYALPAFNTSNLEVSKALFAAAERMKAPLLIQTTESAIKYAGHENIVSLIKAMEKSADIPVCLHLDHGKNLRVVKKSIALGYKSVMIDASRHSFKKNVAVTRKVVRMAHAKKCSVEAELGALGRIGSVKLTDPAQAEQFVKKTGCDSLAVAIGTSHGAYKFKAKPKIDLKRLKEISELVSIPLVLHGASAVPPSLVQKCNRFGGKLSKARGVPDNSLRKAIRLGVSKINIDTDLRLAFTAGLREFHAKNPKNFDPRDSLSLAELLTQEVAEQKLALFGAKGKAR